MPALLPRFKKLIASGTASQDIVVSPGYRYSLFIAPFTSGSAVVEAVGVDSLAAEHKIALTTGVTTAGKLAEILAPTSLIRITFTGASDVYVELQAVMAVANATETYV